MLRHTLLGLVMLGAATPVLAQGAGMERSKTTGFMLGVGLNGTSVKFEDDDEPDSGSGLTLQLGYGFTPRVTGIADFSGVVLDGDPGEGEVSLAQVFLGARIQFGNSSKRWIPYIDLGLGARELGQKNAQFCNPGCTTSDISFSGGAFMFGGGVSYYATRKLAVTGALNWAIGEFSDYRVDDITISGFEADATTSRFNLGIVWFPGR